VQTLGSAATASLSSISVIVNNIAEVPLMAGFSSRGPLPGGMDLLKPDVTGNHTSTLDCLLISE